MRLRRETSLGIGTILALQLLLSMLAIALLTRMGPAVEQILEENVYSEAAVEQMLASLIDPPTAGVPGEFREAMQRAKDNVTEEAETPLLLTIEERYEAAFAGDADARRAVVTSLRQLGQVNRDSMTRADEKAQDLGRAGAWAAAVLGAVALALGVFVYRRLRLRLELPIDELSQTTRRIRDGNVNARCVTTDGPEEVKQIAEDLNWMLDQLLYQRERPEAATNSEREAEIRRALAWMLDRLQDPVMLVDESGEKVATNMAALDVEPPSDDSAGWSSEHIKGTSLTLYRHTP